MEVTPVFADRTACSTLRAITSRWWNLTEVWDEAQLLEPQSKSFPAICFSTASKICLSSWWWVKLQVDVAPVMGRAFNLDVGWSLLFLPTSELQNLTKQGTRMSWRPRTEARLIAKFKKYKWVIEEIMRIHSTQMSTHAHSSPPHFEDQCSSSSLLPLSKDLTSQHDAALMSDISDDDTKGDAADLCLLLMWFGPLSSCNLWARAGEKCVFASLTNANVWLIDALSRNQ